MARAKTPAKTVSKSNGLTLYMGDRDAGFKTSAPSAGSGKPHGGMKRCTTLEYKE